MLTMLALVEVHPLDGSESFISARMDGPMGEFDFPLTDQQAQLIITITKGAEEPLDELDDPNDGESFSHSPVSEPVEYDDAALILPSDQTTNLSMGTSHRGYDDDDL